jgi:hypothetical protein
MSVRDDASLRNEFDALMKRSGMTVPAGLEQATFAGYLDLRRMAAILRQPRQVDSEPANVFVMEAFLRGR